MCQCCVWETPGLGLYLVITHQLNQQGDTHTHTHICTHTRLSFLSLSISIPVSNIAVILSKIPDTHQPLRSIYRGNLALHCSRTATKKTDPINFALLNVRSLCPVILTFSNQQKLDFLMLTIFLLMNASQQVTHFLKLNQIRVLHWVGYPDDLQKGDKWVFWFVCFLVLFFSQFISM